MFVIGKRDMEADTVSVRVHGKGNLCAKPRNEVILEKATPADLEIRRSREFRRIDEQERSKISAGVLETN